MDQSYALRREVLAFAPALRARAKRISANPAGMHNLVYLTVRAAMASPRTAAEHKLDMRTWLLRLMHDIAGRPGAGPSDILEAQTNGI